MWLLNRLIEKGDQPTARFAFQGTVNWMRALAILSEKEGFSHEELKEFYKDVPRRPENTEADTLAFECIFMAMHNVSSLNALSGIANPYECVRSAIVAWYYAIYYASKTMLAAASGVDPQTHSKTGKIWQADIVERGFAQSPFHLYISNITPNNIKSVVSSYRGSNSHDLNAEPVGEEMAWGALFSYLSGTADYEKWRLEEQVKSSSDFKSAGFTNFRKKAAQGLRDKKLSPANVNFIGQSFRYRGKANYRDAIYLSYGSDNTDTLLQFSEDLASVASSFVLMASHYISRRVNRNSWGEFCADINKNSRFELPFEVNEI